MELFGLSPIEIVVIGVVAILAFGQRLPQVAGEAAATLQKFKRSLSDLRRETGIDQEIYRAKREFEDSVRKPLRKLDLPNTIQREAESARSDVETTSTPPAESAETKTGDGGTTPPRAEDSSAPGRD